jgi:hypothetical protein
MSSGYMIQKTSIVLTERVKIYKSIEIGIHLMREYLAGDHDYEEKNNIKEAGIGGHPKQ